MATKSEFWSHDPSAECSLRMGKEGFTATPAITTSQQLKNICAKFPTRPALRYKAEAGQGDWSTLTFQEYYKNIQQVARALIGFGVKEFTGVCIMGFNAVQWFLLDFGAIVMGALPTGIYTSSSIEATQFIIQDCKCKIVFGENEQILEKLLAVKGNLPDLIIVKYVPGAVEMSLKDRGVLSWEEFLEKGASVENSEVEQRMAKQKPNNCCTLIYTSGTTGNPKGVMMTHDNLMFCGLSMIKTYNFIEEDEVVSYLPLSHVVGQIFDLHIPLLCGSCIYFAQPDALKGSLTTTLKQVRPTLFFGVPRVWEKMCERLEPAVNAGKLAIEDVVKYIGLDRCKLTGIGAAAASNEVVEFFRKAGLEVLQMYGTSESTGPGSISTVKDGIKKNSVGKALLGTELKISDPNENGEGEVCLRGRHIYMGYLGAPELTAQVLEPSGWYQTGDIGRVDDEGYLFITGRIKEIIVTSGGKNIAPVSIEIEMKQVIPLAAYCVVVGDNKNYLNMLVTLKSKLGADGLPTDDLDEEALEICKKLGVPTTKVSEAMNSDAVQKHIQDGIDKANEKAPNDPSKVKKFKILAKDFSVASGELTPTLKLKRIFVLKKYADIIESIYT